MIRVFLNPSANPSIPGVGGIDRVIEAQATYLPEFDVSVSNNPDDADLIANHATLLEERPGTPMVSHTHGLYWSGYEWPTWTDMANSQVIESMRRADAITAPSEWVAGAIKRGLLNVPEVIYHGVNTDEWIPGDEDLGFVLWNKGREDAVSNPGYMQEIARRMPNVPFVSTFGVQTPNVKITGPLDHRTMKTLVQKSSVYLQTTRETFGISTLEALSCGIPVAGWDYGGQSEIVIPGETGYLAPYGDYAALQECIERCFTERERLSENCRHDAILRWTWPDKIQKYAELYKRVLDNNRIDRPRVSVIVTTYNLARFLPDCINSVQSQSVKDWEMIVVDDCSSDNPKEIIESLTDPRIRYFRTRENVGLSTARNIGWRKSRGRYIIFLDADDMLDRATLEILADALDRDTSIHIAYGSLDAVSEDGSGRHNNKWPHGDFDWRAQMSHLNQLPYASMMTREVLDRSGGYRERDWRAEDASLWCRLTSFGFRAKHVTDRPTLIYRFRNDSKSAVEHRETTDRDGDWTRWFPWRTGAASGAEGEDVYYRNKRSNPNQVPFGAQGNPPKPKMSWPVHHHADPAVSIIIPVAPSHQRYLIDALDSCLAQTIVDWEAIVIDDSPDASMPEVIQTHPFARVFHSQGAGTSRARNIGLMHAHGQFVFFLDADDVIEPTTLEDMLKVYVDQEGYIYSDCKIPSDSKKLDGPSETIETITYDQETFIRSGYTDGIDGQHSVSALVAVEDIRQTDGFDEALAYWEDWAIYLELARLGVRGTRVAKPLLIYRFETGIRRRASKVQSGLLREALRVKYQPYTTGEKQMCACGGGNGGPSAKNAAIKALSMLNTINTAQKSEMADFVVNGMVRLRYVGQRSGGVPYRGKISRKLYVAGLDPANQFIDVDERDAPDLMRTDEFEFVDTARIEESLQWR